MLPPLPLAASSLLQLTRPCYQACVCCAEEKGIDPSVLMAAAQGAGLVSGADMANLLVDVDKRLKAMEGGSGVGGGGMVQHVG